MLIDTHTHLYLDAFDDDRQEMIERAIQNGVGRFLLPNIDLKTIQPMMNLVNQFPTHCFPMMGLHPCDVKNDYKGILDEMGNMLLDGDYIAIGETGLDYYWDKTHVEEQKKSLKKQIEWAKKMKLPIVLHCRDSMDDVIDLIEENNSDDLTGVFHCFTGDLEQADRILALKGFYLGIGGVLTFKNSGLDKVIKHISIDHLLLETDSPFLTPVPFRGKRNESSYVRLVAEKLAEIHDIPFETIAQKTTSNACELFGLD
jgi:TatD DNase family protein